MFSARRGAFAVLGAVLLFACASCSSTPSKSAQSSHDGGGSAATSTTTLPAITVSGTPSDSATNVPLDSPIVIKAPGATLGTVSVAPAGATTTAAATGGATTTTSPTPPGAVAGGMSADKSVWLGVGSLLPGTTYQVAATATAPGHRLTLRVWKFTTLTPTDTLHTSLNVFNGSTYGVGMPIVVTLNHPVPQAEHKAVEQRLKITTSKTIFGAWRWYSNTSVHFRPAQYWPAHTNVTLNVDFAGLNAGNGVWGVDGRTVQFTIGDSHISTVDALAHTMTVATNGVVVNTIPVSTGRDKYPTKSGIHVTMDKSPSIIMDSATVGIPRNSPDGYYETVLWDVRISNSGEFVHAAPWSVGDQGHSNVSHGCVNVSTANAEWFYNYSQIGDIVNVIDTGTPDTLAPDNGYGDWQIPFNQWAN